MFLVSNVTRILSVYYNKKHVRLSWTATKWTCREGSRRTLGKAFARCRLAAPGNHFQMLGLAPDGLTRRFLGPARIKSSALIADKS